MKTMHISSDKKIHIIENEKDIEDTFYECLLNGSVYFHSLVLFEFPDDAQYTITKINDERDYELRHIETYVEDDGMPLTYDLTITVPVSACVHKNVLETYINHALINKANECNNVAVVTDAVHNIAKMCGFTQDEIRADIRIQTFGMALVKPTNQYKIGSYWVRGDMTDEAYYEFVDYLHNDLIDMHDHVDYNDTIICDGKYNISIMYTKPNNMICANSVSINWGVEYSMSVHCDDEALIELRDCLIKRYPIEYEVKSDKRALYIELDTTCK